MKYVWFLELAGQNQVDQISQVTLEWSGSLILNLFSVNYDALATASVLLTCSSLLIVDPADVKQTLSRFPYLSYT